jgi:hypothetical protein
MMNAMLYKGGTVDVIEQSGGLTKIRTQNGDEFTVRCEKLRPIKVRRSRQERLSQLEDVSEEFVSYLCDKGVSIRVYCAEEHVDLLAKLLESNGAALPESFEPSDTHSRGGVYRPYAPGIICIFPAPESGRFSTEFSLTVDGQGHIARTGFGLSLIRAGFPITVWKGKL